MNTNQCPAKRVFLIGDFATYKARCREIQYHRHYHNAVLTDNEGGTIKFTWGGPAENDKTRNPSR